MPWRWANLPKKSRFFFTSKVTSIPRITLSTLLSERRILFLIACWVTLDHSRPPYRLHHGYRWDVSINCDGRGGGDRCPSIGGFLKPFVVFHGLESIIVCIKHIQSSYQASEQAPLQYKTGIGMGGNKSKSVLLTLRQPRLKLLWHLFWD